MQTFCFKLATSGLPIEPAVQCWPYMRQNDECDCTSCQIKCGVNKGNLLVGNYINGENHADNRLQQGRK